MFTFVFIGSVTRSFGVTDAHEKGHFGVSFYQCQVEFRSSSGFRVKSFVLLNLWPKRDRYVSDLYPLFLGFVLFFNSAQSTRSLLYRFQLLYDSSRNIERMNAPIRSAADERSDSTYCRS